jgi:hypothetical protein
MVTSTGDKHVVPAPGRLAGKAERGYARTLEFRMGFGAAVGALAGAGSSLILTSVVGGGPAGAGEALLALFGGLVGGGYLGAFFGMCATREP